jgi:hypothetical protein
MCMIEMVAHDRFYKDVAQDPLRPAVPKVPVRRHISPPPDVASSRATHDGGASSSSSANSGFLKMFWGIFAMCHHIEQRMDVMDRCIDILHRNQEIIHSQRDDPLIEFPDKPVYPPVPDPYASLTQAELAAFGVGVPHAPPGGSDDDNDDEEEANDDEETEDDE